MSFNIKKALIDPLLNKKIKIPSVKNIVLLKSADRYEEFGELIDSQKQNLFEKPWMRIVPGLAIGALGIGSAVIGYINTRRENEDLYDKAELMLNEAAADYEINKKGE